MIQAASGSEEIMKLFFLSGRNLFSKREKIDHELYTKVNPEIKNRNMKKLYTKMHMTLGIGKHSL